MAYVVVGFIFSFVLGYAIAMAKYSGIINIGTLWIDQEMPEERPLLYLELNDGVGYFMDDKHVMMDVRAVVNEKASRE